MILFLQSKLFSNFNSKIFLSLKPIFLHTLLSSSLFSSDMFSSLHLLYLFISFLRVSSITTSWLLYLYLEFQDSCLISSIRYYIYLFSLFSVSFSPSIFLYCRKIFQELRWFFFKKKNLFLYERKIKLFCSLWFLF